MNISYFAANPSGAIDGGRLWRSIEALARIGALPGGGCSRAALTDEDREARELFARWSKEAGCEVRVDALGNMFAWRTGADPDAPAVLIGSHLDTQPHGGRFDGIYGVMCGLEVLRTLNDAGVETIAPVVVVNWTNEEGVRFAPGLSGSAGFSGLFTPEFVLDTVGTDGSRFGDELHRIGFAGDFAPSAALFRAYIEPHIEQGPHLENAGVPVGVVSSVQGVRWFNVELAGADRHAGTTSMQVRRDTFMAAARMSVAMRSAALAASEDIRFTIGRVFVEPGSPNTVPGRTEFAIDLRHTEDDLLERLEVEFRRIAAEVAAEENVSCTFSRTMEVPSVAFDEGIIRALEEAATRCGYPARRMVSGAMHDASNVARMIPTAMIFVPSRGGISHAEDEWTEPEDVTAGCKVLFNAVLDLAGVRPTG